MGGAGGAGANSTIGTWQQKAMNVQLEVVNNEGFLRPFPLKF